MSLIDILNELKSIKNRLAGVDVKDTASTSTVTVDTSATELVSSSDDRGTFVLSHESATTIYVGFDNTVATSGSNRGHPIVANQPFGFDNYSGDVYAIASSGTVDVTITETV